MISPDWKMILSQFEAHCASEKGKNSRYRIILRSFVHFLDMGSYSNIDKEIIKAWLGERSAQYTLEATISALFRLKEFIHYLSAHGLCMPDILSTMQADTTLLDQLADPQRYCTGAPQLHAHWQAILSEFKILSRGYAPRQIVRSLRVAGEYVALLQKHKKTSPDRDTFLEWLDGKLARCKNASVENFLAQLERFCQFFLKRGDCSSNPVTMWRREHLSLQDALTRRREGKPPQGRPPRFQSILINLITEFIDHKRGLGRTYKKVPVLEYFDRYLQKHHVEALSDIDEKCLLDFLGTFPHWKDSTRHVSVGLLREFFCFLERRGEIDPQHSPVRCLPRVVRHQYIPHIYTIKEIAIILSELRNTSYHHEFNAHTVVTLIYLVYACGLRVSEVLKLKVQDVNLKEKTIFIRRTKFGKSRLIPFGCHAGEYLAAYHSLRRERLGEPSADDFFFVHSIGKPYSRFRLEKLFRKTCQRAGIITHSGLTPRIHDIRHSFAVHRLYKWYQDGANPQEKLIFLSLYMGHVEIKHTQHYLHLSENLLRLAGKPIERSMNEWIQERQVDHDDE
jgi:integrase/recombinase XerD